MERANLRRLPLDVEFGEDLIVVNKPAGFSTHAVDPNRPGLAELLEKHLLAQGKNLKMYVVHRLDKTTTGVLLFATSEQKAKQISESFKNNLAKKRYVFLTAAKLDFKEITIHSKIEKQGKLLINQPCSADEANAETSFKLVKLNALFQYWEAWPKTGKTHQIRLHAKQAGIPILGDVVYGGAEYPHLCLHAESLEIPGVGMWKSFPPIFFERMGLARDAKLAATLSALDRRQRLFNFLKNEEICLRLSHQDQTKIRIDLFGPVIWVYWYADEDPTPSDLNRMQLLQSLTRRKVMIQKMQNRGKDPLSQKQWSFDETPSLWQAKENGFQFQLRSDQGLSPGLFLDQRENRFWLYENSKNKRVLNLFSYTCGFSLAAALGGASEVVSVDLSKVFLDWGKANARLNLAEPSSLLYFAQDSQEFLKQTLKKNKRFDLIVLDPPSFSRNGSKVWKFEKDFPNLLKISFECLNSGGKMICSSNFEKWDFDAFENQIKKTLGPALKSLKRPELSPLDFETPGEVPLMKSLILEKK